MAKSAIATAYVQVRPSMEGVAAEVRKQYDPAGTSAGASFGANMVGSLKKYITVAAVGKVLKDTIVTGGALQQSLGGINTLFKDSAATVIANAQNAYKNAGMSANAYMETVTGFSASLIKSLGGDTAAAADVANTALTDMSDNANKMGTSMELIQNAYQGFAKQNYTMLDNLKLGYGGTKSEMQRLLADAQKLTGVKYDINNLSDVYNAIHEIQKELGIMDATADEAGTTLTGSFNAMKASLIDVMGYLSLGMDVTPALNALAETVSTFLVGNLIPMVWNVVAALPGALVTFIQALVPGNVMEIVTNLVTQLTTFITTSLPQILANGTAVISELMTGFVNGIPSFLTTASDLMKQLVDAVLATGPQMIVSGLMLIADLVSGLLANLPQMLQAAAKILGTVVSGILAFLPQMLAAGISLIVELAAGLIGAIPSIAASIPVILASISAGFESYDWNAIGTEMMNGIGRGISAGVGTIISAARSAALSAFRAAKAALGIASPSKLMRDEIGKFIPAGIAVGIEANTDSVSKAMKGLSTLTADSFNSDFNYNVGTPVATNRGASTFNFYIYGAEGQSVEELSEIVMQKIQSAISQKEAVYA